MMLKLNNYGFYDRKILTSIILSLLIHSAVFWFTSQRSKARIITRIDNVEFIDETSPASFTPTLPTKSVFQAIKDRFKRKKEVKELEMNEITKIVRSLPPVPGVNQEEGIALDGKQLDRSQAKGIDLDKFDRMEGQKGGVTEVIRIASSGEQKGSEDILSKAPIKIDKKERIHSEAPVGLFSSPGSGGEVDLERVPTEAIDKSYKEFTEEKKEKVRLRKIPSVGKAHIKITGPLSKRGLKYKPLPAYPEWAAREGISAIIKLQIMVNPDGTVKPGIFVLCTSGYGSWDRAVIDFIKRWQFAPLSDDERQIVQTGIIIIKFVLE
ncbi:energy transducer TonB [candidate division WOR-3 bacterium]|nr:energy transducer TonB [candidate division WOR-3 bacterium]